MQRGEIFELLKKLLIELFEVDASKIKLESRIYEDLEIDSIDAIDMIDYIRKQTGYRMEAAYFKEVRTLSDIVEVVFAQLNKDSAK